MKRDYEKAGHVFAFYPIHHHHRRRRLKKIKIRVPAYSALKYFNMSSPVCYFEFGSNLRDYRLLKSQQSSVTRSLKISLILDMFASIVEIKIIKLL